MAKIFIANDNIVESFFLFRRKIKQPAADCLHSAIMLVLWSQLAQHKKVSGEWLH